MSGIHVGSACTHADRFVGRADRSAEGPAGPTRLRTADAIAAGPAAAGRGRGAWGRWGRLSGEDDGFDSKTTSSSPKRRFRLQNVVLKIKTTFSSLVGSAGTPADRDRRACQGAVRRSACGPYELSGPPEVPFASRNFRLSVGSSACQLELSFAYPNFHLPIRSSVCQSDFPFANRKVRLPTETFVRQSKLPSASQNIRLRARTFVCAQEVPAQGVKPSAGRRGGVSRTGGRCRGGEGSGRAEGGEKSGWRG